MLQLDLSSFPVLETERLILRQLEATDADDIFLLRSDTSVNEFINRPKAVTKKDADQFIQMINNSIAENKSLYWAITEKEKNKLVGTICIWNIDTSNYIAETGYELLPAFQGKGIMQEALSKVIEYVFRQLKLKTLEAYTHPDNSRSSLLLEKFNFKRKHELSDTGEMFFSLNNF